MSLIQLLHDTLRHTRNYGPKKTLSRGQNFAKEASLRSWHNLTDKNNRGKRVLEENWDLLVVLDACRVDSLEEVATDYDFLGSSGTFESAASYSLSWMEENFTEEYADEMAETVMVTGNPFSETALEKEDFRSLDEVWKHTWDNSVGTIPPRPITDCAIRRGRELNPDRMIVHYMQPHEPFTTHPELQAGRSPDEWADASERSLWERVAAGEVRESDARAAYMDELRMILNEVELLLNNVNAETAIITADHGEAFGEGGVYGHPRGVAIDALRLVPWYEASGEDLRKYAPDDKTTTERSVQEERLRDLGYL